ncbi:MAG TPA: isoprenylcysteine carboxylmethyltransferase family protein [Bacteroidota bacterium]|nr:isoprenylcysteine carboxylmethyltransferase family protein [Bacteroidota bacterium]
MTEKSILPPTYFFASLAVALLMHFLLGGTSFIIFPLTLLGIIPVILGCTLNVWTDRVLKQRRTTVKPYEKPAALITDGPFTWFRQPMYFGMTLILAGASILCGTWGTLVGPLSFWLIIRGRFIPNEEKILAGAFGEQYAEYKKRVRRWM